MCEHFPQHYAVTFLGFVTGLRPSTLFPLRIAEDVRWTDRRIWIRRSHTHAQEVMHTTKTGVGYSIGLPSARAPAPTTLLVDLVVDEQEVMDVLLWHIDANVDEGPMRESGLLFHVRARNDSTRPLGQNLAPLDHKAALARVPSPDRR